jgi:hypothetical protein
MTRGFPLSACIIINLCSDVFFLMSFIVFHSCFVVVLFLMFWLMSCFIVSETACLVRWHMSWQFRLRRLRVFS